MNDIERLNEHMAHVLGRINHLEIQVASLVAQVAKLQTQVERANGIQTFADGSKLISTGDGFTIVDAPAPYNRNQNG
jgi:hypothetical protein